MGLPKNPLLRGMIVKAILTAAGIFTGMPAVDPDHFNFVTWQGFIRMMGAIMWIVFVNEMRYIEDYFKQFNGTSGKTNGEAQP